VHRRARALAHPSSVAPDRWRISDVHAVAIEVVALDNDVAEIDADAQFDAVVRRGDGVPLGHRLLHFDRAAHRIDDAGKLHQHSVTGGLNDPAPVLGDLRIEELAAQRLEAFERAFFVSAPISREYPATSAARIATSRRVWLMSSRQPPAAGLLSRTLDARRCANASRAARQRL
jgi:hypothetical protein